MRIPLQPNPPYCTLGHHLVDDLAIPDPGLNLLFAALILTVLGTFLGGNLLLLDAEVLRRSAMITLPCLGLVFMFYALSRHLGSLAWGLTLAYGVLWLIAYVRLPAFGYVFYALSAVAAYDVARRLRVAREDWWPVLLMAVLGTATVLGVVRAYTTFDLLPRLHAGAVHQDTLYHASIAAMIKNYGVVSTGLHGLIETPYHVLSHSLMAGLSRLSGTGVIEVYGVGTWVLFAPLLLFCVAACCVMLDRAGQLSIPLVWGSAAVLLSILPLLLGRWALYDSYFVSESYLVSLGIFLLGLGLLSKRRLTNVDLLLVVLTALLVANAKASVGLIYTGLWLTRLLWLRTDRWKMDLGAFLLSLLVVSWAVFDAAGASAGGMSLKPLGFIRSYSLWGSHLSAVGNAVISGMMPSIKTASLGSAALLSFVLFHFLLSWILIVQVIYHQGLVGLIKAPLGVYSMSAMAAGLLTAFTVAITGGSAYFFSNVAMFISLPSVVAMMALVWGQSRKYATHLLGMGILVVSLISLPAYYKHSILFLAHFRSAESPLVAELLALKENAPLHFILKPRKGWLESNPVEYCTAQPFVFPAVSERAWVGVIQSPVADCSYIHYGYDHYGLTSGNGRVGVEPRLLPGMHFHNVDQ